MLLELSSGGMPGGPKCPALPHTVAAVSASQPPLLAFLYATTRLALSREERGQRGPQTHHVQCSPACTGAGCGRPHSCGDVDRADELQANGVQTSCPASQVQPVLQTFCAWFVNASK